jgi:hypothetical protein
VLHLAQANRFTKALSVAHLLNVDKTSIYSHLATQCVRLTRKPDAVLCASIISILLHLTEYDIDPKIIPIGY